MENTDDQPVAEEPQDFAATEHEGPANPSDEPEDRPKSPEGGRSYDDDEVAVDPEDAPSANSFIGQITIAMLVLVVLVVLTALTGSAIMMIVTFIGILLGIAVVLRSLFQMMSTD